MHVGWAVLVLAQAKDDSQLCHALLHQRGLVQFSCHNYSQAVELLTPAVFFSTSVTAGNTARLLAASYIQGKQPGRALQYTALAEQREGSPTAAGCLLSLHALLMLHQGQSQGVKQTTMTETAVEFVDAAEGVCTACRALASCADFDNHAMMVSDCSQPQGQLTLHCFDIGLRWMLPLSIRGQDIVKLATIQLCAPFQSCGSQSHDWCVVSLPDFRELCVL
jgi:hypothetical protein